MREIYVISDLHLGGEYSVPRDPNNRGFRICTQVPILTEFVSALAAKPTPVELVINGDIVDFLAETDKDKPDEWRAFTADQDAAAWKLQRIIKRDREFFDALTCLLDRGHRLTLLLGNHDIELALPAVRRRLVKELRIEGRHDFHLLDDGQAYVVGSVLIEHGNRYDPMNMVDYDGLRRLRSLLSRRQPVPPQFAFEPPPGSTLVATLMNRIKKQLPMIDLLKPETSVAVPVAMALLPDYGEKLRAFRRVANAKLGALRRRLAEAAMPGRAVDLNAAAPDAENSWTAPEFASSMTFRPEASESDVAEDLSADEFVRSAVQSAQEWFGTGELFLSPASSSLDSRMEALLNAVAGIDCIQIFADDREHETGYKEAAESLASKGFDAVVFGHTHIARNVELDARPGARYFNTGTWADFIRFPSEKLTGTRDERFQVLRSFVEDLEPGRLGKHVVFRPTYLRMELDDDGSVNLPELKDYRGPAGL